MHSLLITRCKLISNARQQTRALAKQRYKQWTCVLVEVCDYLSDAKSLGTISCVSTAHRKVNVDVDVSDVRLLKTAY